MEHANPLGLDLRRLARRDKLQHLATPTTAPARRVSTGATPVAEPMRGGVGPSLLSQGHMLVEQMKSTLVGTPLGEVGHAVHRWRRRRKLAGDANLGQMIREEAAVGDVLRRAIRPDSNCVDIGAHLGSVLSEMTGLAPDGLHAAIEPTPRKAEWLRRKFRGVRVIEAALSDVEGRATFYDEVGKSGFSGLGRPSSRADQATTSFEVALARLDDLFPAEQIDFVKMDIEGAELFAFRGGRELLARCRPTILFECTHNTTASFHVTPGDVWDELCDAQGYRVFTPCDWLAGGEPLGREAFSAASVYPFRTFNFVAAP